MDEKKLLDILENDVEEGGMDHTMAIADIEKRIRRSIFKHTFKNIVIIVASIGLVFASVFFFNKYKTYNPNDEEDFSTLLIVAFSHFYPNSTVSSYVTEEKINYTIDGYEIPIFSTSRLLTIYGSVNAVMKIGKDKMTIEPIGEQSIMDYIYPTVGLYYDEYEESEESLSHDYNTFESIPETSYIRARIALNNNMTLEEVAKINNDIDDGYSSITWIGFDIENKNQIRQAEIGTFIDHNLLPEFDEVKYPNLFLPSDNYDGNDIQEHFLSELKILNDHPEFNALFNDSFAGIANTNLNYYIDLVENEELEVKTVYVCMKKDVFLETFDKSMVKAINIHEISLTQY